MICGWMLFLVALMLTGVLLRQHDKQTAEKRRHDARVQCERTSPPWKTAECAAVK